jgi:hypothetical protein
MLCGGEEARAVDDQVVMAGTVPCMLWSEVHVYGHYVTNTTQGTVMTRQEVTIASTEARSK